MKKKTGWTLRLATLAQCGLAMIVMCAVFAGVCSGGWAQQVLAKNFSATWSSVTPSTATVRLNASGELKSLMLKVPYCDAARAKLVDNRTGYVYLNQALTPGGSVGLFTNQRVALTGEQYGVIYLYLWMDPASATSVTLTGQYLYRK